MRDVAKLAGVSQSTVSRVLTASSTLISISDDTTRKVLDAVDQLGYRPNQTARSLRGLKTNMIAVMIADITNPMYHSIVRTIQGIARKRNYDILIANTDHIYANEMHFCEAIIRRPVDGVLMVPYLLTSSDLDKLMALTAIPLVVLAWPKIYPNIDSVSADDEKATNETVKWLIEQKGHQRIGYIGVSRSFPPGERRRNGFLTAMKEAGLSVPDEYIQQGDFSIASGQTAMRELLKLPCPPTAVLACNDLMAIGALDTAQDMHFGVPNDVAIIGFDNIPETSIIRPRLSTIAQYPVDMAQQLAKLLFDRIDGYKGPIRTVEVPCQLIERETT
jgi:DNA-binding LacI/PurR family transcriptional regulator